MNPTPISKKSPFPLQWVERGSSFGGQIERNNRMVTFIAFVLGVIGGFILGWYVFKKAKID